ncbi:MAG: 30S ribosomal protein S8 [Nanoarchaeota archaeon]|nr:30S ribosomal protein S8 [Nanoarchaeota archaeon]MCG2718473.1 30S ribosomal protein S8 [Nanoarchaeota archaeon]
MMNDTIASALSNILNADKVGKEFCLVKPYSKMLKEVLTIMNNKGYIGSFEVINDGRGDIVKVNLVGKVNKCGAIKPRFSVTMDGFEKFEKRYLPAKGFGIIIVSTSKGVMTHVESIEKKIGGKLIAYIY